MPVMNNCIQAGVLTGDNVRKLFDYAKEHNVRVSI
jgi:hypothetical protein